MTFYAHRGIKLQLPGRGADPSNDAVVVDPIE